MPRGYTRVRLADCGAGASEVWSALLEAHDPSPGDPPTVGEVRQVFDRSAYLEFDGLDEPARLGPQLVLLAGEGFDGPLATRLRTDAPGGFRPDGLAVGDRCRLRRAAGSDRRYVLGVGDAMDLEVDPSALIVDGSGGGPYADLAAITPDRPPYRRASSVLETVQAEGVEDGLGLLDSIAGLPAGGRLTGDLAVLVEDWVSILRADGPPLEPPTALLGRGPGATPSGDDVIAGLLLALGRTTAGDRQRRVRSAGRALVAAAAERTTTVSTALLAQAARGRAADRVDDALEVLLGAEEAPADWESTVVSATAVGHTSGVDLLVGVLLVPLAVGPALAGTS